MGSKGTSSKAKTNFANLVYTSKYGRLLSGVLKALAFSYLMLVYLSDWNLLVGYALVALLLAIILLRGAAEIYESLSA